MKPCFCMIKSEKNMDLSKISTPEQEEIGFIDKIIDFFGKFKRNK